MQGGLGMHSNETEGSSLDLQGLPTAACPACGCTWLMVPMTFDPETYDVAAWGTEGSCFGCGSRLTVCTPVDKISDIET